MSVLIRGMRPTHSCEACPCYKPYDFGTRTGDSCNVTGTSTALVEVGEKPDWCPLTEMPPHGRLIDFDKAIDDYWDGNRMEITAWDLKDVPIVLEAEE